MAQRPIYSGSCHVQTTAATDNTANTPIKCAGTTVGANCFGFSHSASNRLRFDGDSGLILVNCSFSASCSGGTEAIFYLYMNGAKVTGTDIKRTIGAGAQNGAGHTHALIQMKKGDYVELWCETDASADDITIQGMILSAVQVG